MFTIKGIRKLHGWSHASLDLVLNHLSTISPGDYAKDVPGFGFPTIRDQVVHIFSCEGFWVSTLQGLSYARPNPADYATVSEARQLQQESISRTDAYLSGLTDDALNSDTELRFSDGDTATRTPALILHHVLTHAFHHKGQIVAMCRWLGHPAPDTDLNQFT
jgi:uncharacterized damage-inducible protein DinB